jgi:hypothetical protein
MRSKLSTKTMVIAGLPSAYAYKIGREETID